MRFQVVPAAYVFLTRTTVEAGREVLLQFRQNTGYRDHRWGAAAAGHVEQGESVLVAACREAAEELGIALRPEALTPLTVMHRTGGDGQPINERVDFFFSATTWFGRPRRIEPAKAAALRWYPLDALPEPVVPHERFVLDSLLAGDLAPVVTFGFGATVDRTRPDREPADEPAG